jgi:hypothetical protein
MASVKETEQPKQYTIDQSVLNKSKYDKYIMVLSLPKALLDHKSKVRDNFKIDSNSLQMSITGSPVPDIIIPAIGIPYAGQEVKISSHVRQAYENVFVSFKIDNLYRNWWVIYYWLDLLNNEREAYYNKNDIAPNEAQEAMKDYTANFTIYGLDEYGNRVIQFDYEGCFPVSLTSPKFDDKNPEDIESQFEFAFSFFTSTLV